MQQFISKIIIICSLILMVPVYAMEHCDDNNDTIVEDIDQFGRGEEPINNNTQNFISSEDDNISHNNFLSQSMYEEAQNLLCENKVSEHEPLNNDLKKQIKSQLPLRIQEIMATLSDNTAKDSWPHFIILTGKPGVGKSTIARYIPEELGWQDSSYIFDAVFLANEFQNSGAQNIKVLMNLIKQKSHNKPSIVVFEEINTITDKGTKKHHIDRGTSTAFWCILDSLTKKKNIVVVGTTNDISKQHPQITSRAGSHLIEIINPNTAEFAYKTLLSQLPPTMEYDKEWVALFADQVKNLTARDLCEIKKCTVQKAIFQKKNVIDCSILQEALNAWESSQSLKNKSTTSSSKIVKKIIKEYGPLTVQAIGVFAGIYFQKKGYELQLESLEQNKLSIALSFYAAWTARMIGEAGLAMSAQGLNISNQSNDIADKGVGQNKWFGIAGITLGLLHLVKTGVIIFG